MNPENKGRGGRISTGQTNYRRCARARSRTNSEARIYSHQRAPRQGTKNDDEEARAQRTTASRFIKVSLRHDLSSSVARISPLIPIAFVYFRAKHCVSKPPLYRLFARSQTRATRKGCPQFYAETYTDVRGKSFCSSRATPYSLSNEVPFTRGASFTREPLGNSSNEKNRHEIVTEPETF